MAEPSTVYPVAAPGGYWNVSGGTLSDETRDSSVRASAAGLALALTVGFWEIEVAAVFHNASTTGDFEVASAAADGLVVTAATYIMRTHTQNNSPGAEDGMVTGTFTASEAINIGAGKEVHALIHIKMLVTTAGTWEFFWGQDSTDGSNVTTLRRGATSRGHLVA